MPGNDRFFQIMNNRIQDESVLAVVLADLLVLQDWIALVQCMARLGLDGEPMFVEACRDLAVRAADLATEINGVID